MEFHLHRICMGVLYYQQSKYSLENGKQVTLIPVKNGQNVKFLQLQQMKYIFIKTLELFLGHSKTR